MSINIINDNDTSNLDKYKEITNDDDMIDKIRKINLDEYQFDDNTKYLIKLIKLLTKYYCYFSIVYLSIMNNEYEDLCEDISNDKQFKILNRLCEKLEISVKDSIKILFNAIRKKIK